MCMFNAGTMTPMDMTEEEWRDWLLKVAQVPKHSYSGEHNFPQKDDVEGP